MGRIGRLVKMACLLAPLLILTAAPDAAGASTLNWFPQVSNRSWALDSVDFVNGSTGWAVGDNGVILKTSNGGASWTKQASGTHDWLTCVDFVNPSTGWAVGGYFGPGEATTVLKTADGGATWVRQGVGMRGLLRSCSFVSTSTGWAVGDEGLVVSTVDGGATWTTKTMDPPDWIESSGGSDYLRSVRFVDAKTGWVSGDALYATEDGGETWSVRTPKFSAPVDSLHFVDSKVGWAVGGATIQKTSDGGATWRKQADFGYRRDVESVDFTDATHGWAVGIGTICKTINGGETWTINDPITDQELHAVRFLDAKTGWAVGWGTVVKTVNGGGIGVNNVRCSNPIAYDIKSLQTTRFSTSVDTADVWAELSVGTHTGGRVYIYKGPIARANKLFFFPLWSGMGPDGKRLPVGTYDWTLALTKAGQTSRVYGKIPISNIRFTLSGISETGVSQHWSRYMIARSADCYLAAASTSPPDRVAVNVSGPGSYRATVGAWPVGPSGINVTAYLRAQVIPRIKGMHDISVTGRDHVAYTLTVLQ